MNFLAELSFDDYDVREEHHIRNILKEKLRVRRLIASIYEEIKREKILTDKDRFKEELIKRGVNVKD